MNKRLLKKISNNNKSIQQFALIDIVSCEINSVVLVQVTFQGYFVQDFSRGTSLSHHYYILMGVCSFINDDITYSSICSEDVPFLLPPTNHCAIFNHTVFQTCLS